MKEKGESREPFMHVSGAMEQLVHDVIGCAMSVHRTLGPGFLESHYENALCLELAAQKIPFRKQHPLTLHYRDQPIGDCRIDLLIDDKLIVELKAVDAINDVHKAQLLAYLKATRLRLGLLMNFNEILLKNGLHRIIN